MRRHYRTCPTTRATCHSPQRAALPTAYLHERDYTPRRAVRFKAARFESAGPRATAQLPASIAAPPTASGSLRLARTPHGCDDEDCADRDQDSTDCDERVRVV